MTMQPQTIFLKPIYNCERIVYNIYRIKKGADKYDENGDRQIVPFDTFEQAVDFLSCCSCKVGVMTTAFYVNRVTE